MLRFIDGWLDHYCGYSVVAVDSKTTFYRYYKVVVFLVVRLTVS